jgi:hypothetical protein
MVYSVRGFTAATATTGDPLVFAQLWNPDATENLRVMEFGVFCTAIAAGQHAPQLVRSTTRGTPGSTVTPDADNSWDNLVAPQTGALLDLALFSANPTRSSPELLGWNISGGVSTGGGGMGWVWSSPIGMLVPPGTGVVLQANVTGATAWAASEVYFVWEEGGL